MLLLQVVAMLALGPVNRATSLLEATLTAPTSVLVANDNALDCFPVSGWVAEWVTE